MIGAFEGELINCGETGSFPRMSSVNLRRLLSVVSLGFKKEGEW